MSVVKYQVSVGTELMKTNKPTVFCTGHSVWSLMSDDYYMPLVDRRDPDQILLAIRVQILIQHNAED